MHNNSKRSQINTLNKHRPFKLMINPSGSLFYNLHSLNLSHIIEISLVLDLIIILYHILHLKPLQKKTVKNISLVFQA